MVLNVSLSENIFNKEWKQADTECGAIRQRWMDYIKHVKATTLMGKHKE